MSAALGRVGCGALPPPVAKERELLGSVIELVQSRDMYLWQNLSVEVFLAVSRETGVPILVLPLTSWEIKGKMTAF